MPESWAAAGFEVRGRKVVLGRTVLQLTGSGGGFEGWSLDGVEGSIDGLATAPEATDPRSAAVVTPASVEHPNGIVRIDHVVVRSGDCDRTIAAFELAGLEVRGGRSTNSYGAPMRQTFLWAGDVIVELMGPDLGEPTTDEPASIFGLALVAEDLDKTAAALGELMGTPRDAVQQGRRIAGLRVAPLGIPLPLAVMSPHI